MLVGIPWYHFNYSSTSRVVGVPLMISQPVSSIFLCSPLPSGTGRIPVLSIPWCRLPTSSCVWLVFFSLSLCFATWFWPDLMNGRHVHTAAVYVSLRWSGGLRVVQLPSGSWHGPPRWRHGLCKICNMTLFREKYSREIYIAESQTPNSTYLHPHHTPTHTF